MYNFANALQNINSFREDLRHDEDPTFLTFSLNFVFDGIWLDQLGIHSSPLLFGDGTAEGADADLSAQNFLTSRKLLAESARLGEFKRLLKETQELRPWYFQSIAGLEKMWENSSNMAEGQKARECVLTVNTLESVDLRISYLAELYRKAVYDGVYMREILPDNMRYFQLEVYVAEFRNFSRYLAVDSDNVSDIVKANTQYFLNDTTYYKFDCYMCEFDFSKTFPMSEISVNSFDEPATNKFDIKVGWFFDRHMFGFHSIMVDEDFAKHTKSKYTRENTRDGKTGDSTKR